MLAPGDRVAADARLLEASGLEVEEAALTGESLPVAKGPTENSNASRIVLEGSDVTVGSGRRSSWRWAGKPGWGPRRRP